MTPATPIVAAVTCAAEITSPSIAIAEQPSVDRISDYNFVD